jgi:hypothetical protein
MSLVLGVEEGGTGTSWTWKQQTSRPGNDDRLRTHWA